MTERLILHQYAPSGNCYKIRLTAALLGLRFERVDYDILRGETRTPEFRAHIDPLGRIPVLQVGQRFLPESNAACVYLADGTPLIPHDRFDRADMLRWMFFEQYHHEPNIATLRFWLAFVGMDALGDVQRSQIPEQATRRRRGAAADGRSPCACRLVRGRHGDARRHLSLRLHACRWPKAGSTWRSIRT